MDIFAPGSAATALLVGTRIAGVMMIAPVFASRTLPLMLRAAFLVVLVILLQPVAYTAPESAPALTVGAFVTETLIGFAIGFGAAIFVGAAEAAGDFMAVQMGLSGAASLDPMTELSVPVLGQFTALFAVTLLLAVDGHLLMIDSLAASMDLLPVGTPIEAEAGLAAMVAQGSALFMLGLRFAAPVVAVVLVANAALAVLGRAAPQLNILAVAFPVQIGVGLLALAASVPLFATFFTGWSGEYDSTLVRLFSAMQPGGR